MQFALDHFTQPYTMASILLMQVCMQDFFDIIRTRRTIRRFQPRDIDRRVLVRLVDVARAAPSAASKQPLEYVVVDEPAVRAEVFANVAWAGYIAPARNPAPGQEPMAYIVILVRKDIAGQHGAGCDVGAAAQSIMLAAWSLGIGSCWMGAIQRAEIAGILHIPENMSIDTLIALGYPAENPVMEDVQDDGVPQAIKYYLDSSDRLHVPKRRLRTIGHLNRYGGPLTV
jgi:nitroreductase